MLSDWILRVCVCVCCAVCGILVLPPDIEPGTTIVKAPSPNHWTTMEFPDCIFKILIICSLHQTYIKTKGTDRFKVKDEGKKSINRHNLNEREIVIL